jgi:hypothetical protein
MTVSPELLAAYRFHRNAEPREWSKPSPYCAARIALARALHDVASGDARFPRIGKPLPAACWQASDKPRTMQRLAYVEIPAAAGLRLVGKVEPESYGGSGCWMRRDHGGWFTLPHGETFKDGHGFAWGVVFQLPARDGKARFVAGYAYGGTDPAGSATVDFGTIYEGERGDNDSWEGAKGNRAARKAAYAADALARHAAEEERNYQTAYEAGSEYDERNGVIHGERKRTLQLLAEFRQARAALAGNAYEALCGAIRDKVKASLATIRKARLEREKLASGDYAGLEFWNGDARLRAAFNEGACATVLR